MNLNLNKTENKNEIENYLNALRKYIVEDNEKFVTYLSYLLYLRNIYDSENKLTLVQLLRKKFLNADTNLEYVLKEFVSEKLWKDIRKDILNVSNDTLKKVILETTDKYLQMVSLRKYAENSTPDTLVDLVIKILNINPGDKVCDICGGIGNFITKAYLKEKKAIYYSKEINTQAISVMEIRVDVLLHDDKEKNIYTEAGNIFDLFFNDRVKNDKFFDKIFGNYPWRIFIDKYSVKNIDFLKYIDSKVPGILKRNMSDWLFNILMIHMLKDTGKAVGIMTNGSIWNQMSDCKNARRYFLSNGLIEAIIALPANLFKSTSIPTVLIVFSHGNKKIKMIDATSICVENMRQKIFSTENIETIYKAYLEETENSIFVNVEDILKDEELNIHPKRYLTHITLPENGKELKTVLTDLYRGSNISAKELDKLKTDKPTLYRYVMLQNINNGMIDEELPYLSKIDEKYEKFIISNRSLIISKTGPVFKSAVVDVPSNLKILASGNMFILKIDETKANPYYIQALFESSYGKALVSSISSGSVISTFSKKALENLVIPLPALEKQNEIANKYQALQDSIKIYKMKLEDAYDKKAHIFDNVEGE